MLNYLSNIPLELEIDKIGRPRVDIHKHQHRRDRVKSGLDERIWLEVAVNDQFCNQWDGIDCRQREHQQGYSLFINAPKERIREEIGNPAK
jgi:hypothetical protein